MIIEMVDFLKLIHKVEDKRIIINMEKHLSTGYKRSKVVS